MLDDLRQTLNKVRGDYSKNESTSTTVGKGVVKRNLDLAYVGILLLLFLGYLQFQDAILLAVYGAVPLVFDTTLIVESIPLLGRVLPRATILVDLGMGMSAVTIGISLGVIYTVYRLIGAIKMGLPYYTSLKRDD